MNAQIDWNFDEMGNDVEACVCRLIAKRLGVFFGVVDSLKLFGQCGLGTFERGKAEDDPADVEKGRADDQCEDHDEVRVHWISTQKSKGTSEGLKQVFSSHA